MALLKRLASLFALRPKRVDIEQRFELLRTAITGTMSKVYLARDRRTGEQVALKILDPEKTAMVEARFRGLKKPCEGEIALQLKHPNIVTTLEYGWTTRGEPYLVMEYLAGEVVSHMLVNRDPLLDGRRLSFIRQAAEAVAAVHEAGFIHRDVCPRNLIAVDDYCTVKLIDFGLTVPATPPFMRPGNRTGTPNYMAPELARRQPTDQRIDVFSFGVTAYEILTGELPWPRGTTGLAAMSHVQPGADVRKYRPQIHPRLAEAVHACIEPDVNQRCPSLRHFLRMIQAVPHEDAS